MKNELSESDYLDDNHVIINKMEIKLSGMRETKLLREINKYQSGIYFEYNWIPDKLGRILGWGSHFEINIMSTSSFEEEIYISNYEFLSLIIGFYNSGIIIK